MFYKKSTDAKHVFRLENIIQHRMRDEITLAEKPLAEFGDWLERELDQLVARYCGFVTVVSQRGSIGR